MPNLKLKSNISLSSGFTLIELLIVIVIVGILSGIVIAVIDPIKQQNRARDAVVLSSLNKAALSASGYLSAYGKSPDGVDFKDGLTNATVVSGCTPSGATTCTFTLSSVTLPSTCDATTYKGNSTTACNFYYYTSGVGATPFQIIAKSHGQTNNIFVYDSGIGKVKLCSATGTVPLNMPGCTDY